MRSLPPAAWSLFAALAIGATPAIGDVQDDLGRESEESSPSAGEETVEGTSADGDEGAPQRPGSSPDGLPSLDVYLPEGELDFRLSRLVKNAFFEGQLRYNFFDADISAFLRYRYYGYRRTYTAGFFDEVEFENLEKLDNDFERVRGGLLLVEWPMTFHRRSFFLAEADRITSNKEELRFSTDRTNVFFRVGYQIGTPNDARSNAIVGETRANVQQLFTAPQKVGPRGAGATLALSYGTDLLGDFEYAKAEFEALKRFDLTPRHFLVARLHGGTFPLKETVRDEPDIDPVDRFSIPRSELLRLDGRDNLKGVAASLRGTEELHSTMELFLPWFLNDSRRFFRVNWTNFYWILYGGVGTIGLTRDVYTDSSTYIPDAGVGFEASFRLRSYDVFVSGILAHALADEGGLEAKLSFKSRHW